MELKLEEQAKTRVQREPTRIMKLHIPMCHKKRYVPEDDVPEHNKHENQYSSNFISKVYIKCTPEPKRIFGKITDVNGKMRDRVVNILEFGDNRKWVLDHQEMKNSPEDIELYIDTSSGTDIK